LYFSEAHGIPRPVTGMVHRVLLLLVIADAVPGSLALTLKMEAIRFSKTSVLTRATQRHIPGTAFFICTTLNTTVPTYIYVF
jgi:hypothetical protein